MEREQIKIYKSKWPVVDAHCEIAEKAATLLQPLNFIELPVVPGVAPTEYSIPIGYQEVLVQPISYRPDKQTIQISLGHAVVPTVCQIERCDSCILNKLPGGEQIMQQIRTEAQIPTHGRTTSYNPE